MPPKRLRKAAHQTTKHPRPTSSGSASRSSDADDAEARPRRPVRGKAGDGGRRAFDRSNERRASASLPPPPCSASLPCADEFTLVSCFVECATVAYGLPPTPPILMVTFGTTGRELLIVTDTPNHW